MQHVYTDPFLVVLFVAMVALIVYNEIHRRREQAAKRAKDARHRTDPVWKHRDSL